MTEDEKMMWLMIVVVIFWIVLIIWGGYDIYKKYKQIRQLKDIKQLSKEKFIEGVNVVCFENEDFIREVKSYIGELGNEVLYIGIANKKYVLKDITKMDRKLTKFDEILVHKAYIECSYQTSLPLYTNYGGLHLNESKLLEETWKEYFYSSFFVDDDKQMIINNMENELYEQYCFYYKKINEIVNLNFIHFVLNSLTRNF